MRIDLPSLMKKVFFYIVLFLPFLSFNEKGSNFIQQQYTTINFTLHFQPVCENEKLEFGKVYHNIWGEDYSVERFRFYISHISLLDTTSNYRSSSPGYFLVDGADSNSTVIQVPVNSHHYNKLEFLLGVDSAVNTQGAQTGALDPLKGMFWTWNSGYVMAKLEGLSSLSTQPAHTITYHIGGYRNPNNTARTITLAFGPGNLAENTAGNFVLLVTANTNAWFSGQHEIRIRQTPGCMTPGVLASNIADNYAGMFRMVNASTINP